MVEKITPHTTERNRRISDFKHRISALRATTKHYAVTDGTASVASTCRSVGTLDSSWDSSVVSSVSGGNFGATGVSGNGAVNGVSNVSGACGANTSGNNASGANDNGQDYSDRSGGASLEKREPSHSDDRYSTSSIHRNGVANTKPNPFADSDSESSSASSFHASSAVNNASSNVNNLNASNANSSVHHVSNVNTNTNRPNPFDSDDEGSVNVKANPNPFDDSDDESVGANQVNAKPNPFDDSDDESVAEFSVVEESIVSCEAPAEVGHAASSHSPTAPFNKQASNTKQEANTKQAPATKAANSNNYINNPYNTQPNPFDDSSLDDDDQTLASSIIEEERGKLNSVSCIIREERMKLNGGGSGSVASSSSGGATSVMGSVNGSVADSSVADSVDGDLFRNFQSYVARKDNTTNSSNNKISTTSSKISSRISNKIVNKQIHRGLASASSIASSDGESVGSLEVVKEEEADVGAAEERSVNTLPLVIEEAEEEVDDKIAKDERAETIGPQEHEKVQAQTQMFNEPHSQDNENESTPELQRQDSTSSESSFIGTLSTTNNFEDDISSTYDATVASSVVGSVDGDLFEGMCDYLNRKMNPVSPGGGRKKSSFSEKWEEEVIEEEVESVDSECGDEAAGVMKMESAGNPFDSDDDEKEDEEATFTSVYDADVTFDSNNGDDVKEKEAAPVLGKDEASEYDADSFDSSSVASSSVAVPKSEEKTGNLFGTERTESHDVNQTMDASKPSFDSSSMASSSVAQLSSNPFVSKLSSTQEKVNSTEDGSTVYSGSVANHSVDGELFDGFCNLMHNKVKSDEGGTGVLESCSEEIVSVELAAARSGDDSDCSSSSSSASLPESTNPFVVEEETVVQDNDEESVAPKQEAQSDEKKWQLGVDSFELSVVESSDVVKSESNAIGEDEAVSGLRQVTPSPKKSKMGVDSFDSVDSSPMAVNPLGVVPSLNQEKNNIMNYAQRAVSSPNKWHVGADSFDSSVGSSTMDPPKFDWRKSSHHDTREFSTQVTPTTAKRWQMDADSVDSSVKSSDRNREKSSPKTKDTSTQVTPTTAKKWQMGADSFDSTVESVSVDLPKSHTKKVPNSSVPNKVVRTQEKKADTSRQAPYLSKKWQKGVDSFESSDSTDSSVHPTLNLAYERSSNPFADILALRAREREATSQIVKQLINRSSRISELDFESSSQEDNESSLPSVREENEVVIENTHEITSKYSFDESAVSVVSDDHESASTGDKSSDDSSSASFSLGGTIFTDLRKALSNIKSMSYESAHEESDHDNESVKEMDGAKMKPKAAAYTVEPPTKDDKLKKNEQVKPKAEIKCSDEPPTKQGKSKHKQQVNPEADLVGNDESPKKAKPEEVYNNEPPTKDPQPVIRDASNYDFDEEEEENEGESADGTRPPKHIISTESCAVSSLRDPEFRNGPYLDGFDENELFNCDEDVASVPKCPVSFEHVNETDAEKVPDGTVEGTQEVVKLSELEADKDKYDEDAETKVSNDDYKSPVIQNEALHSGATEKVQDSGAHVSDSSSIHRVIKLSPPKKPVVPNDGSISTKDSIVGKTIRVTNADLVAERIYLESLRAQVLAELKVHVADEEIRLALEGRLDAIKEFYKRRTTVSQLKSGNDNLVLKEVVSFGSQPKSSAKSSKPKILRDGSVDPSSPPQAPSSPVSSLSYPKGTTPRKNEGHVVTNTKIANHIKLQSSSDSSDSSTSTPRAAPMKSSGQDIQKVAPDTNIPNALKAANLSLVKSKSDTNQKDDENKADEFDNRIANRDDIPTKIYSHDTSSWDEEEVMMTSNLCALDATKPDVSDAWSFYRQINNLMADNRVYDYAFQAIQKDPLYPYLDSLTGIADCGDDGTSDADKKVKQRAREEFYNKSPHRICHILSKEAKAIQPELNEVCEDIARKLGMKTMAVGPVKTASAALIKSEKKYGGNPLLITDFARVSLFVPDVATLLALIEIVLSKYAYIVKRIKLSNLKSDHSSIKGGYRDCKINLDIDGHVCEVQVHLEAMWNIMEEGGYIHYRRCVENNINDSKYDISRTLIGLDRDFLSDLIKVGENAVEPFSITDLECDSEKPIRDFSALSSLYLYYGLPVRAEYTLRQIVKLRTENASFGPGHEETVAQMKLLRKSLKMQHKYKSAMAVTNRISHAEKSNSGNEDEGIAGLCYGDQCGAFDQICDSIIDPSKKERTHEKEKAQRVEESRAIWLSTRKTFFKQ